MMVKMVRKHILLLMLRLPCNLTNKDWKDGVHIPSEGFLKAGIDGTTAMNNSPHGRVVLQKLPIVGNLID